MPQLSIRSLECSEHGRIFNFLLLIQRFEYSISHQIMKKLLRGVAAFCALFALTSCDSSQNSAETTTLSTRETWKTALSATQIGRVFDAAASALKNGDYETLQQKAQRLRELGATREAQMLAENVVVDAMRDDMSATSLSTAQKQEIEAQAAKKYRAALQMSPDFPSKNWMILNALGYFLADRGTTPPDFRQAEELTRRALKILDSQIGASPTPDEALSRATVRDSVAWSLFRQKKFDQAWSEQKKAVAEAKSAQVSSGNSDSQTMNELNSHLQQIEKSLGFASHKADSMPSPTPTSTPDDSSKIIA